MEESSSAAVAAPFDPAAEAFGPWKAIQIIGVRDRGARKPIFDDGLWHICEVDVERNPIAIVDHADDHHAPTRAKAAEYARLIAAAPDLLAALVHVRSIIVEAANTGFNWADGDWAERLFASQGPSFDAVAKATQPSASRGEASSPTLSKAGA